MTLAARNAYFTGACHPSATNLPVPLFATLALPLLYGEGGKWVSRVGLLRGFGCGGQYEELPVLPSGLSFYLLPPFVRAMPMSVFSFMNIFCTQSGGTSPPSCAVVPFATYSELRSASDSTERISTLKLFLLGLSPWLAEIIPSIFDWRNATLALTGCLRSHSLRFFSLSARPRADRVIPNWTAGEDFTAQKIAARPQVHWARAASVFSPNGGEDEIRTHDPHVANVMLYQLSYFPVG